MPLPRPRQNRQSCDRCHLHKLRCPKQSGNAIYTRCFKAGAACVYSPVGTAATYQHLPAMSGTPPLPDDPLDWGSFSFGQFAGLLDIQHDGAVSSDEATRPKIPVEPRVQCFEELSSLAATISKTMSGLPPVAKYHTPGSKFEEHCLEISKQYSLKASLELALSQTQKLVDMYPETVRLALETLPSHDCNLADCIHICEPHSGLDGDPFARAARLATKVDYPLLKLLLSCHYRCTDMTDLLICQSHACLKLVIAANRQGVQPRQFDIPELKIGTFTASPRFSPSIVTTVLINLHSSLASCVPKLSNALKDLDQNLGKEARLILLECDLTLERQESTVERLKKLQTGLSEVGIFG
ncbi:hypothetical protein LY78DRAFT_677410 [Colletotrichum sublineola]|uniref:Zn(2)-C6 fungal-type domain-containing protein n=1 Tax=Colletotrichum sublineola TaxID=1173701 RepID=A0A066WU39_COLSU|nr:hypothetical protein LY78DRAFT_677410 [Colletotrichum sublineola]KDN60413.1 hypothetical protein CSUB01_00519 [Colletotrichum sublineola]